MKLTSKQQHTKDIVTGCGVTDRKGYKCGRRVVGRVVDRNVRRWQVAVCERHAKSMVANGFRVKLYKAKDTAK